jgi:uncharacterized membrane protein YkvA (DUF1232 family)
MLASAQGRAMMAGMSYQLPATVAKNERTVQHGFWKKLLGLASKLPFAIEAAAGYFCAFDPKTPAGVKAMLMAALAYFVLPFDAIPDFLAGLGYGDDAAVIAGTVALVARHIKPEHYAKARAALGLKPEET